MRNGTRWRNARMSEVSPNDHFVCVQSVVADRRGSLWVVDPAAPDAEKTVKGGPKVVEIDLKSNNVKRIFPIGRGCRWSGQLPERHPHRSRWKVRLSDRFRFARRPGRSRHRVRAGMARAERRSLDPIRSERHRDDRRPAACGGRTDGSPCSMPIAWRSRRTATPSIGRP